ncbi:MAG: hypothetical protein IT372_23920 [Polyangiaceae bacterium]|nr:hypothetical protein [Polyangiaceae bacterium]
MIGPIVIQGRKPENVVELNGASRGAVLLMRRPPVVSSREAGVRWYVGCQALLLLQERTYVTVPAYPARRGKAFYPLDELALTPLPAIPKVVAAAYFPADVFAWWFLFCADDPEHPDAKADVWVYPMLHAHDACGFFKAPCRGSR